MNKIDIMINEYVENQLNENIFKNIRNIFKYKKEKIVNEFKKAFKELIELIKKEDKEEEALFIINKSLSRYTNSTKEIRSWKEVENMLKYNIDLHEMVSADKEKSGVVNWLKSVLFQGTISAHIFTGLQIFFELDKLISSSGFDIKRLLAYSFLWILISSGVYKQWKKGM